MYGIVFVIVFSIFFNISLEIVNQLAITISALHLSTLCICLQIKLNRTIHTNQISVQQFSTRKRERTANAVPHVNWECNIENEMINEYFLLGNKVHWIVRDVLFGRPGANDLRLTYICLKLRMNILYYDDTFYTARNFNF